MKLAAKLLLKVGSDYILGPGRIELLKKIAELGSLRQAAGAMGMGYRWAWGRLKKTEAALDLELLVQEPGSGRGHVKALSPAAREVLAWYLETETRVEALLAERLAEAPACLRQAPGQAAGE
ncbi:molybdenum-binding protein [Deltaproteobacteria bacterium]|nr:molybdenum-binding protein [Deltaproteobacteria bacterium]